MEFLLTVFNFKIRSRLGKTGKILMALLLFSELLVTCDGGRKHPSTEINITGKVVGIIDGDTYDLLLKDDRTIRVRMEGIDAPEKGMPFYKVSKKYLANLCFGKNVFLEVTGRDSHGRYLGFTKLEDGSELSHLMLRAGLAWHFKKYNSDSDLSKIETDAKKFKKGLWIDKNPMPPWVNRSLHRRGISTKDSFNIRHGNR